jgi:hypothetical protein
VNVRLHIERLVLDAPSAGVDRTVLARVVEGELTRLLEGSGLAPAFTAAGAVPTVHGGNIEEPAAHPEGLGVQIAAAVHSGLTRVGWGTR